MVSFQLEDKDGVVWTVINTLQYDEQDEHTMKISKKLLQNSTVTKIQQRDHLHKNIIFLHQRSYNEPKIINKHAKNVNISRWLHFISKTLD